MTQEQLLKEQQEYLAKEGYEAYRREANWQTFDNRDMPTWDQIGEIVQNRWMAAATRIIVANLNIAKQGNDIISKLSEGSL